MTARQASPSVARTPAFRLAIWCSRRVDGGGVVAGYSFSDTRAFAGGGVETKTAFAPNGGVLYADSRERRSQWVVNIPWAGVTGVLVVNGRQHRLAGWGYQDHQWGALRIQAFASAWVWGR